jgi:hypothetical protein
MLEQLIEKALAFDENALEFNNPNKLHFDGNFNKFALEWTDTGCFLLEKDNVKFTDFDKGRTHQLNKNWVPGDWNLYRALYLKGWESKKFRIDPPLKREETDIHGTIWEYTEFYRPGPQNGEWSYTNQATAHEGMLLENMKTDFYELLKAASEVATENSLSGVPNFSIGSRQRDGDGHYFVKNFTKWDQPLSKVIKNAVAEFTVIAQSFLRDQTEIQQEVTQAIALWESLNAN